MTLASFLNPEAKENIRFVLSERFRDGDGDPEQWEMRPLTAKEGREIRRRISGNPADRVEVFLEYAAESLVTPNLRDKELLDQVSAKAGRPVFTPAEVLWETLCDSEICRLVAVYTDYNGLNRRVGELVEQAKN